MAVAVVERFKQEPIYGLSAGTKMWLLWRGDREGSTVAASNND